MSEEREYTPQLNDTPLRKIKGVVELVKERIEIKAAMDELEARKSKLSDAILAAMMKCEVSKVEAFGHTIGVVEGKSGDKLDARKLMEAGVTPKQIKLGTVEGKPFTYLGVRKAAAAKD